MGQGPLRGIRVLEFAALGPTPFAAMMLADMGAEILRVERIGASSPAGGDERFNHLHHGRASIAVDLKSAEGLALAKDLAANADILLEGFRPGAMEKLGLGPDRLMNGNPQLIYGRMTGWGQDGPLTHKAGHDINYLSVTGGLYLMGPHDRPPVPPLNLVGNFGGGGMLMVAGLLAALVERTGSGRGQLVDAAMVDGASLLLTQIFAWSQMGIWRAGRGGNLLDGSAYFYRCYDTADGKFLAVGALEPVFHAEFLRGLGLDPNDYPDHLNPVHWETRSAKIAAIVRQRPQAEWLAIFDPLDACVTPVLSPEEAVDYPPNAMRTVHRDAGSGMRPAPAPRFGRTPGNIPGEGETGIGESLRSWKIGAERINLLIEQRIVAVG